MLNAQHYNKLFRIIKQYFSLKVESGKVKAGEINSGKENGAELFGPV
jgi:hypothetical protein